MLKAPSLPTMASRSSTLWKTDLSVMVVLPPFSSKVTVSSITRPAAPSNSNV
jgi:hypothetical protein